ncbi:MAG: site-2 protease family protein [Clostridia bacterium]|nr:site-2 protease family protein [Clostridia bacterium]
MTDKNILRPFKIGKLHLHIWTILLFCTGLFFEFFEMLVISYTVATLHEAAHILVAKRCRVPISKVEILPFGITMHPVEEYVLKPVDEVKICLAGPLCNFVVAYLVWRFYGGAYREYIVAFNLAMGIFNLLPAIPLDGGRIMRALFVKRFGHIRSTSVAFNITKIVAALIGVFGILVVVKTRFNFSFLVVGCFLIANLTEEKKRANSIIMKDILYSRKKLAKGVSPSEALVANLYERAMNVISKLSYDRYYIVYVADTKGEVLKTVTETEIIEKTAVYGTNITMKKIIEM